MPKGAVYVGRPTKWGNPYKVGSDAVMMMPSSNPVYVQIRTAETAVKLYRRSLFNTKTIEGLVPELRGKDLCCWCSLDEPCHADVLLEVANK